MRVPEMDCFTLCQRAYAVVYISTHDVMNGRLEWSLIFTQFLFLL